MGTILNKINLKREDFIELKNVIEKLEQTKVEVREGSFCDLWIESYSVETELYLKSSFNKKLIISRIIFENRRKGIASQVLYWLKKYAKTHEFETIIIESVISIEMIKFCEKHSFKANKNQGYIENGLFYGNYELEI